MLKLIISYMARMVENGVLSCTLVEVEIGRTFLEGNLPVNFPFSYLSFRNVDPIVDGYVLAEHYL